MPKAALCRIVQDSLLLPNCRDFAGDCLAVDSLHLQAAWSLMWSRVTGDSHSPEVREDASRPLGIPGEDDDRSHWIEPAVPRSNLVRKQPVPWRAFHVGSGACPLCLPCSG